MILQEETEKVIEEINTNSFITDFFYNSYIVEIFGGIILSLMGLFLIWFLRPKVKIAREIAKTIGENDIPVYSFKVINKSYLFQLVDVHFELTMLKPDSTPRGMNLALSKVDLKSNHVWFLSRRKWKKKKNDYATYAIILDTNLDYDMVEKWKSGNGIFLDLKVIAKNNFSGITSIIHEKFNHSSCVKTGVFEHGNSFEIIKEE